MKMDREQLSHFMREAFPQAEEYLVDRVTPEGIEVRVKVGGRHLRPGGTISGPTMFALADVAIYLAILSRIGPVELAVTTSASIDFLRKPQAGRDLVASVTILKLGRVLAVCDAMIRSEGSDDIVARSSMTYSLPPQGK